jgi:pyruvate dehydrogenase E2 component (dihydrolipoamide acetyltransferase)
MPIAILMPALSPTMTEGKVVKWLKQEGDPVKRGEVIAEVETDKAILEIEATEEGTLGKLIAKEGGACVEVDHPIAILFDARDVAAMAASATNADRTGEVPKGTGVREISTRADSDAQRATQSTMRSSPVASPQRIFASPLARRLASQRGIDLGKVNGLGPLGRIEKADVEKAAHESDALGRGTRPPMPSLANYSAASFRVAPHTLTRKVIARRLVESKTSIPHFYLSLDCELDALLSLRERLNRSAGGGHLSINDFIIRASALALREQPAINASWTEEAIRYYEHVDIAVAVATSDGLITPIVRDADLKNLATISNEMKELTLRAREKKLRPEEFQGGGFTISNLGMYGIKQFEAIINPPQAAVLAVGKGEPRAVVRVGKLATAVLMTCTLSCDHRVIDGAGAAKFLGNFKKILGDPARIYP